MASPEKDEKASLGVVSSTTSRQGSCLCGAVEFTLKGGLHSVRYCHCTNCRKFAGTSPAAWAMADATHVEVSKESSPVGRYNSGRGIRCFCTACGSPVWFESIDFPDVVGIPLGVLDDDDLPPPEMHLWVDSNPSWCLILDGLPQHRRGPE